MESDDFPSVAALVRYIHERSEEISMAFVIPPGVPFFQHHIRVLEPCEGFTLFLQATSGEAAIVVRDEAVEAVLNNGILNRMSIKIELWNVHNLAT